MFQNLVDIIAAPTAAFNRLKQQPSVLLPWLLIVLSVASIQLGFFLLVDHDFLVDQLVDQALANNPNAPENQMRQNLVNINPAVMGGGAAVATAFVISVIFAINAVYLNFMAKFGHQQYTFKSWFSLLAWTGIPGILVAVAAWVSILTANNGLISLASLQSLSLDSLLGLNTNSRLLQSLNLPQLWSMVLVVLGYQNWTGATMLKSAVITLAPYVLIYGIWAFISLG